jgi:tetratricopeptide (TPR) repeat protein
MILYLKYKKMETNLAQKAVTFAIQGQWTEAMATNLEILETTPNDIDTLNRLARCYAELGHSAKARTTAQKVLSLDPVNPIALKCLSKYKNADGNNKKVTDINSPEAFLEESGKTKIVELLNLGDKKIVSCLDIGELVKITTHSHKVSVVTSDNKYLGRLPDDLAVRIKNCIKNGNTYSALIKSATQTDVKVFVRELTNKTKSPTFPPEKIDYVSYTPPELVHKEPAYTESES